MSAIKCLGYRIDYIRPPTEERGLDIRTGKRILIQYRSYWCAFWVTEDFQPHEMTQQEDEAPPQFEAIERPGIAISFGESFGHFAITSRSGR